MFLIGDGWAEGHQDLEVEDNAMRRQARLCLPADAVRLHEAVAEHLDTESENIGADGTAGGGRDRDCGGQ